MKIGHICRKEFKQGDKIVKYLEMIVRAPMMESATFTIAQNTEKQKENAPDFNIFYSINRKGDKYPSALVGALWNKVSDRGVEYKNGYIETPAVAGGKMNISVFNAIAKENQEITWSHDVLWSAPKTQNEAPSYDGGYAPAPVRPVVVHETIPADALPVIDINEDEIPF
jgi:uncharacterized protein (DUF736 family)